ncbi:META domain-containing protein [Psychroserpens sp.]|uniref:META domain-containing protein n=1 Tax=Psychroserpens sp. TaxID=2020870 RepID=UPI001B202849|nr:META domain-containing protein [Psychroserpens sp.]MBO6607892.1 META domain-containing protein [Psychroserpens sp.]MBO6632057.1 META domain-containing protein [Psychroserpens sp.]MBO6654981.1 META domain-containing protein [Psychroserpens sp.]MBO6682945.1 META domain-containing protein [Psychroserpens sp.]MBO6751250.1 META domain-containing protein [Psychroserpens sp.]
MKNLALIICSLLLMVSCNSKQTNTDYKNKLNANWSLERINGEILKEGMTVPNLNLDIKSMRVSGNSGCNSFNGSIIEINSEHIDLGDLATTLKLCPEPNYESEFMTALKVMNSYSLDEDRLIISNATEQELLVFSKQ